MHSGWYVLGADIQELADAQYQELLGATRGDWPHLDRGEGHKPPRADIQKLKDAYDLLKTRDRQPLYNDPEGVNEKIAEAKKEWDEKYTLGPDEAKIVHLYLDFIQQQGMSPDKAFNQIAYALTFNEVADAQGVAHKRTEQEAKKFLGGALKKYEEQNEPRLYLAISNALQDVYRRGNESYKLWPWMVKQIKEAYKNALVYSGRPTDINRITFQGITHGNTFGHYVDVVNEAGALIHQLRNRGNLTDEQREQLRGAEGLPENFDVNQMTFKELEDWLMQWKRENRASEDQGEVVYKYHNGWTMQKLTTPEQLQYEGDEMGHCVAGYSHAVGEGRTIIYSLRDGKGEPHVTMEIDALEGPPQNGYTVEQVNDSEDASYNHEPIHPDAHAPGDHFEEAYNNDSDGGMSYQPSGQHAFQIVQIQGTANTTPKPEYQHMVKEFLDSLREKGWKFERSSSWYAPHDDQDEDDEYDPYDRYKNDAQRLEEWYGEKYAASPHRYQTGGEDPYGMHESRRRYSPDWESVFQDAMYGLVEHNDRGSWSGDPISLAQAVYHTFMLDTDKKEYTPAVREATKQELLKYIEKAEDKLQNLEWENSDAHYEYGGGDEDQLEKFEELAKEQGVWGQVEKAMEEEYGDNLWSPGAQSEIAEWAQTHEEDLWMEAGDHVRDEANKYFSQDAWTFLNYLIQLVEKHGVLMPSELPDPSGRHGGLPSYADLKEMPWPSQGDEPSSESMQIPGTLSSWRVVAATPITLHPVDQEHNVWFDEDGNQRPRYRPGWAKHPETGKMEQTGELEDTFLDKQGRQGQGVVAYVGDRPVGSLTWVDDPAGWKMLGTTYVHPDYRQQGIFSQMIQPLRDSGQPIDAYVWNNPWLKQKVRGWQLAR